MPTDQSSHLMLADPITDLDVYGGLGRSVRFQFRYPELASVLSSAMSAVFDALELNEQTPSDLITELEYAAAVAMTEAYEPFAEAASLLARSTELSRTTEAADVRRRALESTALVSATTTALRQRHDRLAERVAEDAVTAARATASSSVPGSKFDARRRALHAADAVRVAAAAHADKRAAAAALTAEVAGQAEVRLAMEAERAAVIVQRAALQAADAIRVTALAVMYEIAVDAACRHFVGA